MSSQPKKFVSGRVVVSSEPDLFALNNRLDVILAIRADEFL
jgi:hypothetical protein